MQMYNAKIPKLPRGVSFEEYKQTTIKPVQLRIINILRSWIDSSFFDFDNKLLYRIGRNFSEFSYSYNFLRIFY
jgi:enoyl reductase-like protein